MNKTFSSTSSMQGSEGTDKFRNTFTASVYRCSIEFQKQASSKVPTIVVVRIQEQAIDMQKEYTSTDEAIDRTIKH
ncbi:hypothetical protein OIU85_024239 [Salix viminalis]|uniref:Uncharacterized protein n=1 Tax=Salix viminalis TaxID=40686 RepID=A0A9Q0U0D4_SALVM|nr:hypothetical protein OIU85_024239 [Salix viminalis]